MSVLLAREALAPELLRVRAEDRCDLHFAGASIFAVFDGTPEAFTGLVTTRALARFPQRIFADLVPVERQSTIRGDATAEAAVHQLQAAGALTLAVREESGELLGAVTRESVLDALLRDERQLRAALRDDERRLRALFEAMPDHAFVLDVAGRYLDRPMRLSERSRHPLEGHAGHGIDELIPRIDADRVREAISASLTTRTLSTVRLSVPALDEGRGRGGEPSHRDRGSAREYELRIVPIEPGAVLCVARDTTEMAQLKAQLLFADRMVTMGTLAAGMAHEINNPLAYLTMNAELLASGLRAVDPLPEALTSAPSLVDDIRDGAARITSIVGDLRAFAKGDQGSRSPIDVHRALASAINIALPQIRPRARLVTQLADVGAVLAVEARLGQVFMNLLVNAAHAIPEGAADDNRVEVRLYRDAAGVHVVVADSGRGLSPEARAHLFEAFFTTKGSEQGTGLGLFISNNIVLALGGQLLVEDGIDGGCAFHVVLPPAPLAPAAPAPDVPTTPLPSVIARVLAIDDEAAIRRVMPALLRPHHVELAGGGREALAKLEGQAPFDVIVCDLMMPDMSGIDLFQEVCERWPKLGERFVFITGGSFTDKGRAFLDSVQVPVLEKPFGRAALRAIVDRIVGARLPAIAP